MPCSRVQGTVNSNNTVHRMPSPNMIQFTPPDRYATIGKKAARAECTAPPDSILGRLGKEEAMADQTGKSKTYSYDYEDYENGNLPSGKTLIKAGDK